MEHNPQVREMADESMVRNLAAQALAIWPQETPLFQRYGTPSTILDVGCGTGEITSRLANLFPAARVTGVDLIDGHLDLARERYAALGDRLTFAHGDAFELGVADNTFDLVVCRHVLQAVPTPERVLAEMIRVAKPGGYIHVLAEDYGMITVPSGRLDTSTFWFEAPPKVGHAIKCDNWIGRHIWGHLQKLPVDHVEMSYLNVDNLRAPRETIAGIFTAWRDGYVPVIAEVTGESAAFVRDMFEATIEAALTGYVLWTIPIASARKR